MIFKRQAMLRVRHEFIGGEHTNFARSLTPTLMMSVDPN